MGKAAGFVQALARWIKERWGRRRKRPLLLAMRLADMVVTHPDMDTSFHCDGCGCQLGLYPSGQGVMARFPGQVDLVCSRCVPFDASMTPAPGAIEEAIRTQMSRP